MAAPRSAEPKTQRTSTAASPKESETPAPVDSPLASWRRAKRPKPTIGSRVEWTGTRGSDDTEGRRVTATSVSEKTAPEPVADRPPRGLSQVLGLPPRPRRLQGDTRGFMLRRWLLVADVAALCAAFSLVEVVGGLDGRPNPSLGFDLLLLVVAIPMWILLLRLYGVYHVDSRRADHGLAEDVAPLFQMTVLWSWSVLLVSVATGIRYVEIPKLALFWVLAFGFLLAFRAATRGWASGRTWYLQNTLVVGSPEESATIVTKILRHPEYGINVVACLELCGEGTEDDGAGVEDADVVSSLGPVPLLRGDVDVLEVVRELDVDRVMLAPSVDSLSDRSTLLCDLTELSVHLDLLPGWGEVVGSRLEMTEMEGMPLLTLPRASIPRSSLVFKRLLDVSISAVTLLALAPLLALCALAIKLDSTGPVLFRQCRVGRGGRRFEVLKFRSMYVEAEALKHQFVELTLHRGAGENGIFKLAEDPRVTRVGRIMRRYSLDEVPQLLNILRGDMSLVGPRPLPEEEHERISGRFRRRVDLMPGLTGLWQVHGRSNIPFDGMVDLDYLYVTNWSLWRDVKLLIRTIGVVVRGNGAY